MFQYMPRLQRLSLDYFPMKGPLSVIGHLQGLKYLRLRMCGVVGDLADLRALTQLVELDLQEIGGPLKGLQKMRQLERIAIRSKVDGYLSDLRDLTQLTHIDFAEGQVIGNLTDLHGMLKLVHLSLRDFNPIEGRTRDLAMMTQLKFLELPSGVLFGHVSDLGSYRT